MQHAEGGRDAAEQQDRHRPPPMRGAEQIVLPIAADGRVELLPSLADLKAFMLLAAKREKNMKHKCVNCSKR